MSIVHSSFVLRLWTVALVLDAATLFLGTRGLGKASGIAIGEGTLGAVGALATGLIDYTDTSKPEDTTALIHGLVSLTATLLFTGSFLLRKQNNWRTEPPAFPPPSPPL